MPKLGLTMTEGTIAHWAVQPGVRFGAGDVIVVVETDKIANEVEAPAAGEIEVLLSPEGAVVAVGEPIARWRLDATASLSSPAPKSSASHRAETPAALDKPAPAPPNLPAREGARVVATPYARRLARDAALDLSGISGSGPHGRIKGADVLRALETPVPIVQPLPMQTPMRAASRGAPQRATVSFATIDIDVSALKSVDDRLAGSRARAFDCRPYVALACFKALDTEGETAIKLGLENDDRLALLEGSARDTLSRVVARMEHLGVADKGGDIAVFVSDGRVRAFAPAIPDGWPMALGVGGVRVARVGDVRHEMTLTLTYDATAIGHSASAHVLERIAALLEEPLHLLAS